MASPPYSHSFGLSTSPQYPTHAQIPPPSRKRPSDMSSASAVKRRKPSMMSTGSGMTTHPLRQTSFPPDGSGHFSPGTRSPSIDTMSLVSGITLEVPGKKKRGRKPKNVGGDDASSALGGRAATAVSVLSGQGRVSRAMTAEEEDEGGDEADVTIVKRTNEEEKKEAEQRSMLVQAFTPEQYRRYERWRVAKLSDAVVRRLINQTLSQSVPQSIILLARSITKFFAGEIIEEARRVQSQWIEVSNESQTGLQSPPGSNNNDVHHPSKETRRGPLTADHLREALRRYKLERKGGSVGLLGLAKIQQSTGVERFGVKSLGRRLLK